MAPVIHIASRRNDVVENGRLPGRSVLGKRHVDLDCEGYQFQVVGARNAYFSAVNFYPD